MVAVAIESDGVVTNHHEAGTIVPPGEPLIWIDDLPVTLARGEKPVFRTMAYTGAGKAKLQEGDDVAQLQEFLVKAGHDQDGRLTPDGVFGATTRDAVKAWQKESGLPVTGVVTRSHLVFHPESVRLDTAPLLGSRFWSYEQRPLNHE